MSAVIAIAEFLVALSALLVTVLGSVVLLAMVLDRSGRRRLERIVNHGRPLIQHTPHGSRLEVPLPAIPGHGTDEGRWWRQGAGDEARYQHARQGANRDMISFLEVLGEQTYDRDSSLAYLAAVYTADWSWRRRLALAISIVGKR